MAQKKGGYIDKFLKKADKAIQEGVKKADEALEEAVEFGSMTAKQAAKTSKELREQAKKERDTLQKKGMEKITEGITSAKNVTSNAHDDLEILKKLGKLRKAEVITENLTLLLSGSNIQYSTDILESLWSISFDKGQLAQVFQAAGRWRERSAGSRARKARRRLPHSRRQERHELQRRHGQERLSLLQRMRRW